MTKKIDDEYIKPMVAPCRTVGFDAPFRWLRKGFSDFKQVPRLSLSYGIVMMIVSIAITYVAYSAHSIVLAIALIASAEILPAKYVSTTLYRVINTVPILDGTAILTNN